MKHISLYYLTGFLIISGDRDRNSGYIINSFLGDSSSFAKVRYSTDSENEYIYDDPYAQNYMVIYVESQRIVIRQRKKEELFELKKSQKKLMT